MTNTLYVRVSWPWTGIFTKIYVGVSFFKEHGFCPFRPAAAIPGNWEMSQNKKAKRKQPLTCLFIIKCLQSIRSLFHQPSIEWFIMAFNMYVCGQSSVIDTLYIMKYAQRFTVIFFCIVVLSEYLHIFIHWYSSGLRWHWDNHNSGGDTRVDMSKIDINQSTTQQDPHNMGIPMLKIRQTRDRLTLYL